MGLGLFFYADIQVGAGLLDDLLSVLLGVRIPTQIGQGSDVKPDGVPMQAGHRSD
jgi:hypothetical protein